MNNGIRFIDSLLSTTEDVCNDSWTDNYSTRNDDDTDGK